MRAEDKERLARRQRMLGARARGAAAAAAGPVGGQTARRPAARRAPRLARRRKSRPAPPGSHGGRAGRRRRRNPRPAAARLRPLSPILRRRKRRRRLAAAALALAALLVLAGLSGALGALGALAGDAVDSAYLYLHRGQRLACRDRHRIALPRGAAGRRFRRAGRRGHGRLFGLRQLHPHHPARLRPPGPGRGATRALCCTTARGTSVRGGKPYPHAQNADHAAGGHAVRHLLQRHAGRRHPGRGAMWRSCSCWTPATYEPLFTWKMTREDGTPVALAFAPDNRRFAVGTVAARDGRPGLQGKFEPHWPARTPR